MSDPLTAHLPLTTEVCGECGGVYGIATRYYDKKRETGGFWTCPYCKVSWGFAISKNTKLRASLEQRDRQLADERSAHRRERERHRQTEKRRQAQKAATTRLRNKQEPRDDD